MMVKNSFLKGCLALCVVVLQVNPAFTMEEDAFGDEATYAQTREIIQEVLPLAHDKIVEGLSDQYCKDAIGKLLSQARAASATFAVNQHNTDMFIVARDFCKLDEDCVMDFAKVSSEVFTSPEIEPRMRETVGDAMVDFDQMVPMTKQLFPLICQAFDQSQKEL